MKNSTREHPEKIEDTYKEFLDKIDKEIFIWMSNLPDDYLSNKRLYEIRDEFMSMAGIKHKIPGLLSSLGHSRNNLGKFDEYSSFFESIKLHIYKKVRELRSQLLTQSEIDLLCTNPYLAGKRKQIQEILISRKLGAEDRVAQVRRLIELALAEEHLKTHEEFYFVDQED